LQFAYPSNGSNDAHGHAIIIINSEFQGTNLPALPGAEYDGQNLTTVFRRLRYTTEIWKNLDLQVLLLVPPLTILQLNIDLQQLPGQ